MNQISAVKYQAGFSKSPCAWIAINGAPIEKWCAEIFNYPDAISLGLAQIWLLDEEEDKLAWSRITPGEDESSTIVPILVCSDDMDFDCIVLVVEQLVSKDTVQWLRWGFSASSGLEVGISTKWQASTMSPLAIFDRNEFEECLKNFKQIMTETQ
jgi:hypothetical protein